MKKLRIKMTEVTISFKTKTNLISELLKQENIKNINDTSFISKISFSKKKYPDIYFHSGDINSQAIEYVLNSKKTIVNSQTMKYSFMKEDNSFTNKIEVIYPSLNISYEKPKEVKKRFCTKLELDNKKKIILFTAKNIKASGVQEFIQIILTLNNDNFIALIESDSKQINNLRFKLSKFNIEDKVILLEDYQNKDELFLAADIFILPTYNNAFAVNILKAMYCKCAVFTTVNNHAKELVDIFSTMEDPTDRSAPFKVDALLLQKNELKNIQKQNRKIAKEFTIEKNLVKINEIIQSV
jgi:glycosyltransferase involved in cell wall biosynthesis